MQIQTLDQVSSSHLALRGSTYEAAELADSARYIGAQRCWHADSVQQLLHLQVNEVIITLVASVLLPGAATSTSLSGGGGAGDVFVVGDCGGTSGLPNLFHQRLALASCGSTSLRCHPVIRYGR